LAVAQHSAPSAGEMTMARRLQPFEKDPFPIVATVNELSEGRSNNVGQLTLQPSSTATAVLFETCSISSVIHLSPRSANAAAAQATTWISAVMNGSFVVSHANNALTDRVFDFSCVGG
jgi:hypothetical protein